MKRVDFSIPNLHEFIMVTRPQPSQNHRNGYKKVNVQGEHEEHGEEPSSQERPWGETDEDGGE